MYLTTSNAGDYLGKRLDAHSRLFHHYPLTVVQLFNGRYYYRDAFGVCIPVPEDGDKSNNVYFDSVIETEAVETCPFCGTENVYPNCEARRIGYMEICRECGKKIMLCDECQHADDNPDGFCDWNDGSCFRKRGCGL